MHELQNAITSPEIAQIIKRRIITVHRWSESGKLLILNMSLGVFSVGPFRSFEALQGLGYTVPDACNDGELQK